MKLITRIEYHTVWGQELFLRSGDRIYPMKYAPGDVWTAEIPRVRTDRDFEYRYEVRQGGVCIRTEWKSHRLEFTGDEGQGHVRKGRIEVRDFWSDVPADLPLRSAPFAEGIFSRREGAPWKAAGTAVPVFSLRSERSFGVGEFRDLKLLADWAVMTGQKVIQLLPVNDTTMTWTWEDSYPYNANSSFALHPQFLCLTEAGVEADEEYDALQKELNGLLQVDYERVNSEKHRLLRKAFAQTGRKVMSTKAFRTFYRENETWLLPYAVFCVLRDEFGTADFSQWKRKSGRAEEDYSVYDAGMAERYAASRRKETGYWYFVQYHLHRQLLDARNYARSKGVVFKGDLPIGVSRTSVDAWVNPRLFNLDSQAGAPPDAFSAEGQNWGFPTYNWEEMSRDGYSWWKSRLGNMSRYFDAFRIDHILGFFRIWEIPLCEKSGLMGHFNPALPYAASELASAGFDIASGRFTGKAGDKDVLFIPDPRRKGYWHPGIAARSTRVYAGLSDEMKRRFDSLYDDFFYHRHNLFWKESAMRKLPALLAATGMLACGEDLGMIPDCVPDVMREYRILSLEIQRMPKRIGENFSDPAHYPYYSVCTTSTHDMNPLRAWWEEDPEVTDRFWRETLHGQGKAPEHCGEEICRRIVEMNLAAPSMLAILPLQDWLSMSGSLSPADPSSERINLPSVSRHYWRYRMHLTLENLLGQESLNALVLEMVSASGRL